MDIQGIREGALFAMHNMQDIWSVRFTCLLVCRSAIFIDSKRGGKQSFPKAEGTSRWLLWMLRRSAAGQSTE